MKRKNILLLHLLTIILYCGGCLIAPPIRFLENKKTYDGHYLPIEQIALLSVNKTASQFIEMDHIDIKVDGVHYDISGIGLGAPRRLELTPGRHSIEVGFSGRRSIISGGYYTRYTFYSKEPSKIELESLPGHKYEIRYKEDPFNSNWTAEIADVTEDIVRLATGCSDVGFQIVGTVVNCDDPDNHGYYLTSLFQDHYFCSWYCANYLDHDCAVVMLVFDCSGAACQRAPNLDYIFDDGNCP